jgi:hypothetical protein
VAVPKWDEFGFKDFILLENRVYLGGKMGDILTALQELRDDAKSMGSRSLVRYSEKIVNQIRRVLHTHWPKDELKFLKPLQKIGVAMMKAIEEREGLEEIIAGSTGELEKVLGKMGVPINKIGANTSDDPEPSDKATSDKEKNPPEQKPAEPAPAPGGAPPADPNPLDPNAGAAPTPGAGTGQPPPPAATGM